MRYGIRCLHLTRIAAIATLPELSASVTLPWMSSEQQLAPSSVWRKQITYPQLLVATFFVALFAIGMIASRDYGISWDEPNMFSLGMKTYQYVFQGVPWSTNKGQMYHGPFFELLLAFAEHAFPRANSQQITILRHMLTFCSFFLGVILFYLLAKRHFRSWALALLGSLFFVLSPRVFAHAFYNSRDIPAMTLFLLSILTLLRLLDRRTIFGALCHALACALLLSVRLTGVLLPPLTLLFLLSVWLTTKSGKQRMAVILCSLVFLIALPLFTIVVWPFLWHHPLVHFLEAYQFMREIGRDGGFFLGRQIGGIGWNYIPVWIAVTTSWLYTGFFLIGVAFQGMTMIMHPRVFSRNRTMQIFLLWFFAPIAFIVIGNANIYDEWRHVLFLYPAFLLLALEGVRVILAWMSSPWRHGHVVLLVLMATSLSATFLWMIHNHPLENMYFSIPSALAAHNFELDYWGLSFREGIEYVLAHDHRPVLVLHPTSSPGYSSVLALSAEEQSSLRYTADDSKANYVLDNFRQHNYQATYPPEKKVKDITVDGITVLSIYRLR